MASAAAQFKLRAATIHDAPAIAQIYNDGIEDRTATFETRLRTAADVRSWFGPTYPIVVVESEGEVIAFAATSTYRNRACYAGIAEVSLYVTRGLRRGGAGRIAMEGIIQAAENAGFWKLLSRVFVDNQASRALIASCGFREVGVYEKHARLNGVWRDVLIVERLIPSNMT